MLMVVPWCHSARPLSAPTGMLHINEHRARLHDRPPRPPGGAGLRGLGLRVPGTRLLLLLSGPARGVSAPFAFPTVNLLSMVVLYGHVGRVMAVFGGVRRGQLAPSTDSRSPRCSASASASTLSCSVCCCCCAGQATPRSRRRARYLRRRPVRCKHVLLNGE